MNLRNQIPEYAEGKQYVFVPSTDYEECPRCGGSDEAFVVGMFRKGQNLQYVQEILGHSDSIITLHYTHYFEKEKKAAMIAYGKAFETGDWSAAQKVDFHSGD